MSNSDTMFQGRTEHIYKVVVIGDPAVGKTSLINKFVTKQFEENYLPTVGVKIVKESVNLDDLNITVNLMFWIVTGQPQFYMLQRPYFNGAEGIIFIFDVTRSSTFSNINNWYSIALKYGPNEIPRILIGNKIDLVDDRKIILPMAKQLSKKINAPYFETSALTGYNVKLSFHEIAELIYKAKELAEPFSTGDIKRERRREDLFFGHEKMEERREIFFERLYTEQSQVSYKVIVIGDPTIGKTTILSRFAQKKIINREFSSIGITLFEKQVYLERENITVNLMLWVIGEVPQFYMLHRAYFNEADGILLVFDIARSSTFYNIKNWDNIAIHYGLSRVPRILVGNRLNLEDEKKISSDMAENLSKELHAPYFETSIINGENINLIFQKMVELIYRAKERKGSFFPYPYIFKPPEPPGDLGVETQAQGLKSKVKDPEDKSYCQYCGKELTKDEQFTHNCRKKPE